MENDAIVDEVLDVSKLKVSDLRRELKLRGLNASGNKNDLMDRLQEALKLKTDETASATSVDELEEDLLNGDDDEHLDETETCIADIDTIEISQKAQKRKSDGEPAEGKPARVPKKIVLNRTSHSEETPPQGVTTPTKAPEIISTEEKKVIKLSELGAKERLEMRAKKFGVPIGTDAKRAARAQRFSGVAQNGKEIVVASVNVCTLKKRAERFGASVSTAMTKLETQEKLEKRKERFGSSTNGSAPQIDKAK